MPERVLTEAELDQRVIPPGSFVADDSAFVDVRLPGSEGKLNFSMIGPGVSENPDQHINLREPHGFNIGAAGMPPGAINNQHLHYTAEVFVSLGGDFEFRIGVDEAQTFEGSGRFVLSVPTWSFRGFRNIGSEDSLLYAVLGGDDTGGIMWSPRVLARAADTGLHLMEDNTLIDTEAGESVEGREIMPPMSEEDVSRRREYTAVELLGRMGAEQDLQWSETALLDSVLEGHSSALAPVIGWGMTMDRNHAPPILNPHTFSLEWLRIEAGNSVSRHRHHQTQCLLVADSGLVLEVNEGTDTLRRDLVPGSVVSIPPGVWRSFVNVGEQPAHALVVNGGDTRVALEWPADTVQAALDAGFVVDAGGYVAPAPLVRRHRRSFA